MMNINLTAMKLSGAVQEHGMTGCSFVLQTGFDKAVFYAGQSMSN